MPVSTDYLRSDTAMEQKLLEYVEATSQQSDSWWREGYAGTIENRLSRLDRYRKRYEGRRSVAQLFADAKTEPFLRASNVGVGIEQIFGEWLTANCLTNTVDLDPPLDVFDPQTGKTDDLVEAFYRQQYLQVIQARLTYETICREIFEVGTAISKWENWTQQKLREKSAWVLLDPTTKQPILKPDASGQPIPIEADPTLRAEDLPRLPDGRKVLIGRISGVETVSKGWQPRLRVRTLEQIQAPPTATSPDPNDWDYVHEQYVVNAWWFLGRQGEMFDGNIPKERLNLLWQKLGVTPEEAWRRPNGGLVRPVIVRESHLKFPATQSGQPVELIVLSLPEHKFILSWRLSPFLRRPYFAHQVWHRTNHWMGKGIPETLFSLRNALDMLLNQDLDAGNIYNQPPLLVSSLAGVQDETFEMAGPGAVWMMRDINGVKFLPPPIRSRDPITMLNWLVSMAQRLWGVTDLNLNAPTSSLSPNISTATGVMAIKEQGNIKFGHFIRNIESVRSQELQMMHDLYRELWKGEQLVRDEQGQPTKLTAQRLHDWLQVRAVGDGILSNPLLRQQRLESFMTSHFNAKNPIVMGDPDVLFDLTKQHAEGAGVHLPLKPMKEMEELRTAGLLLKTPTGQRVIPQAMQELQQMLATSQAQGNGNGNGRG